MQPTITNPLGQITITFQDNDRDSESDRREPVAVSVIDLRRVLEALQYGVWTTAALQLGRTELTDSERKQYELAVIGYSEGSLKTELIFIATVALLGQTGLLPHDLFIALETAGILKAWNTLETTIDAMSVDYSNISDTSTTADLPQGLPAALTRYVRKFARSARDSRHEIRVFAKDPLGREAELQTNRSDNLRILGSKTEQDDMVELEAPYEVDHRGVYEYPDGVVEDSAGDRVIVVRFPEYTRPIPCRYRPNLSYLIGDLVTGDTLTVFGRPVRDPGDRPDAPPRELDVVDVTKVHRNRYRLL